MKLPNAPLRADYSLGAFPDGQASRLPRPVLRPLGAILVAAALLAWPAAWNGYPLVFSDSGTYLSQALNHHLGWDRPVFYSFFLLPLHMGLTTWPAVAAQAMIAAWILHVLRQILLPTWSAWWLVPLAGSLAVISPLPWFAAQLMPDLFTGLLIPALAILVLAPERLLGHQALGLCALSTLAIAAHLSNLPIALALLAILLPLRRRLGSCQALRLTGLGRVIGPPLIAALALTGVNWAGHGVPMLAPYGNIFLLARVIYDGPGRDALARSCPAARWRLCTVRLRLPATADAFLWGRKGSLSEAGGAKQVSAEAGEIIAAAVNAEPGTELKAMLRNTGQQLVLFESGDGLLPWPNSVTPWIGRDFPVFEQEAYATARQTTGQTLLPGWMGTLHAITAVSAILVTFAVLPGRLRRREVLGGVMVAVLAGLLVNAAVTGALSGPHAPYQSRVMWLPSLMALFAIADGEAVFGKLRTRPA